MEYIFTQDLIIEDLNLATSKFPIMTGYSPPAPDMEIIKERVLNQDTNVVFFLTEDLDVRMSDGDDIRYVWIDTGYQSRFSDCLWNIRPLSNNPIFFSLIKQTASGQEASSYYSGSFMGTAASLFMNEERRKLDGRKKKKIRKNYEKFNSAYRKAGIKDRLNDINDTRQHPAGPVTAEEPAVIHNKEANETAKPLLQSEDEKKLYDEIWKNLYLKIWDTPKGLAYYIRVIGKRLRQLDEQCKDSDQFVTNNIGNIIVNTGLLDKYALDICVLYRKFHKTGEYIAYKMITGKNDYITEGFTKAQSIKQLKSISFFDPGEPHYFEACMDDIDITNENLAHMLNDRRDRFPGEIKEMPVSSIVTVLHTSIRNALKIQERSHSYIRPIYTDGRISWVMPFYGTAAPNGEPEMVLVFRKGEIFYEPKTILPYDETVKNKLLSMSLYGNLW